jgi:hypothetical protein
MPMPTNPDWSAWARKQLDLEEVSAPANVRRAYMQRLSDEDFMPPAHLPYAFAILDGHAGTPGANEETAWADVCERQRQRVEEFAHNFFQIPVAGRREQWLKLKTDCAKVPALVNRLDRLEPGLTLDPHGLAVTSSNLRELIQAACEIFVLRPFEAAQARAAFFRLETFQSPDQMIEWEAAARILKSRYSHYEVLAPALVQQVLQHRNRVNELARRRRSSMPRNPVSGAREPQTAAARVAKPSISNTTPSPSYRWVIYVAVMLVGGVIKACMGFGSNSSSTNHQSDFKMPNFEEIRRQNEQQMQDQRKWQDFQQRQEEQRKRIDEILKGLPKEKQEDNDQPVLPPRPPNKNKPVVPAGEPD